MSSGQQLLLIFAVSGVLLGAVHKASTTKGKVGEAFFHFGPPLAFAAAAGAIRLLIVKAQTLQHVASIDHGSVVTEGRRLGVDDLIHFGDRLFYDDIYVYGVLAILVLVMVFDAKVGADVRAESPAGIAKFVRYLMLGYLVPVFFGAAAMYAVYTRS